MRTSLPRRWCSWCSALLSRCCCTSAGDGSKGCVGRSSNRGDTWSNARSSSNRITACSLPLETQLGTTGLYHGERMTRACIGIHLYTWLETLIIFRGHLIVCFPMCFPRCQADVPIPEAKRPEKANLLPPCPCHVRRLDIRVRTTLSFAGSELGWGVICG